MQLSVISPEGIVFSGDAEMIVIPGDKGYFGVLENHAPFMTMLSKGTVTLYNQGRKDKVIDITGGFCEVTPEICIILADALE